MSEVLLGVLNMPSELWSNSELDTYSRQQCYKEAAHVIETLQTENEILRKLLKSVESQLIMANASLYLCNKENMQ